MAKNETRLNRINEELKKELSQIFAYEVKNPNITGMVTVTRAKITPDFKYAKVYVSILNSKDVEKTMQGLKESAGFIRSRIAKEVNLRITPELAFEIEILRKFINGLSRDCFTRLRAIRLSLYLWEIDQHFI
jgi:ribosome-binding factor A